MEGRAIACRRNETAEKLCYVFLIFLLGCLVGWVYEEIFYWITEHLDKLRLVYPIYRRCEIFTLF